jgi:hypothetical protein
MSVTRRGLKLPKLDIAQNAGVKAGILADATYPEQEYKDAETGEMVPDKRAGMPVAVIAAAHNYGTSKVPKRPFMTNAIAANKKTWAKGLSTLLVRGTPLEQALATIGQIMQEDIQQSIQDWPADNSAEWAAHKGFDHGLNYTSVMLRSVKFQVML